MHHAMPFRTTQIREWPRLLSLLVVLVTLGVMFQIAHFVEHALQFGMWVFTERTAPWMSDIAMWLTHQFGRLVIQMPGVCIDPGAVTLRQMLVGMEVLHLVGNCIFLFTIAGLYVLIPNRSIGWAFAIESFHLCEHLMLTASVIAMGKPIGMSTLFGYSDALWSLEQVVGYRVFWHFALNFVPTALMMKGLQREMRPLVGT